MDHEKTPPRYYLVGGGIASLAAAVFIVRDAGVSGDQITIFEQLDRVGGSLDGRGDPVDGYSVRGGRMFEEHFVCTFDLLQSISSPDTAHRSLKDDILAFNGDVRVSSKCRLLRNGKKVDFSKLGLGPREIFDLNRLFLHTERSLQDHSIENCFEDAFFKTNFWLMWSTMFSFQPWHSAIEMRRYLKRFIHLLPGVERIEGILRTRYNQYDSIIAPIQQWLAGHGVHFETQAQVTDVEIVEAGQSRRVSKLFFEDNRIISVARSDRVYLTLGSMTDASTLGSNTSPPRRNDTEGGAWQLWRRLAARYSGFGNPERFCGAAEKTSWVSFTVTLDKPDFFRFIERFTGNVTGTGGLVTFADSGWLMSIVMFHQPHFRDQDPGSYVFWGYGLRSDRTGDFVKKPLEDCTGNEIIDELAGQLRLGEVERAWFRRAKVIPCRMPYITSQFMPRRFGDRPRVRPSGAENFAVMGQYCEMPRDAVFTVEYSVRSAMAAVHETTGLRGPPPAVARTDRDPVVLARAARKLLGV